MNIQSFIRLPSTVYISVWTIAIWLQSLQILDFYQPINWHFVRIQILAYLIILVSEFFIKKHYSSYSLSLEKNNELLTSLYNFCKLSFPILIAMFAIDVLFSGGIPLFWLICRNGLAHSDFGIPTFHGVFHGILLFFTTSSFFLFRQGVYKKESFIHLIFFFFYAILAFNRGIIFIFTLQAFFIYLLTEKKKLSGRFLFLLIIFSFLFIFIFGILGDFRTGYNTFARNITSEWKDFFNFFPKSLLWFYNYSTAGLNNLYGNIPNVHPQYIPYYTFVRLIPTVVYSFFGIKNFRAFTLLDERDTVSTAFEGLVADFGLMGILLYLPIIFLAQINYHKALKNSYFAIIFYGILMQTIVMMVFVDTFFFLPFLLQMFLLCYINYQKKLYSVFKQYDVLFNKIYERFKYAKN